MLYTLEKYLTQKLLMCGYTHINYLVNFKLFLFATVKFSTRTLLVNMQMQQQSTSDIGVHA